VAHKFRTRLAEAGTRALKNLHVTSAKPQN